MSLDRRFPFYLRGDAAQVSKMSPCASSTVKERFRSLMLP